MCWHNAGSHHNKLLQYTTPAASSRAPHSSHHNAGNLCTKIPRSSYEYRQWVRKVSNFLLQCIMSDAVLQKVRIGLLRTSCLNLARLFTSMVSVNVTKCRRKLMRLHTRRRVEMEREMKFMEMDYARRDSPKKPVKRRVKRARANSSIKKDIEGDLENQHDLPGEGRLVYGTDAPTNEISTDVSIRNIDTNDKSPSSFELSSDSDTSSPKSENSTRRNSKTADSDQPEDIAEPVNDKPDKRAETAEAIKNETPPPIPDRDDDTDSSVSTSSASSSSLSSAQNDDGKPDENDSGKDTGKNDPDEEAVSETNKSPQDESEKEPSESPYQLSPVKVTPVLQAKIHKEDPESTENRKPDRETTLKTEHHEGENRIIDIPNKNVVVGEPTPNMEKEKPSDDMKINQMVEQLLHTVGSARSGLGGTDSSASLISDPAILDSLMQNAQITLSLTINGGLGEKPSSVVINNSTHTTTTMESSREQKQNIEVVRKVGEHNEAYVAETEVNKSPKKEELTPPPLPKKVDAVESKKPSQEEDIIAGVVNVTTGEKLTICNAAQKRLIPQHTANLLLEAQAAVGSIINPRNGVKLSVSDAIRLGVVFESYREALTAAEGAFYGYLDPRTNESVSLFVAMSRDIFPRKKGMRLLEAQHASGGVVDPWTGERCTLDAALEAGLIDEVNMEKLKASQRASQEECDVLDPEQNDRVSYAKILAKCIRDLDTGLKFLYIEEKPKAASIRYQPELLHFRSTFRQNVSLQELIDAGLVPNRTLDAFQCGRITKDELADILRSILLGEEPIAGVVNRNTNQVYSISQAAQEGLIRPSTALELLEAQAATGAMIDPVTGRKMSVSKAFDCGLVHIRFIDALVKAEQAVVGYIERGTGRHISLFEAVRKGTVIEARWVRYLDAQLSTGGLIDPRAGYRIPAQIAIERRLLDRRVANQLMQPQSKCFYSPISGENVTYGELLTKCMRSKKIKHIQLLPLHEKGPLITMHKRPSDVHQPTEVSVTRTISVGSHYPKQYVFNGIKPTRSRSSDSDNSSSFYPNRHHSVQY